MKLQFEPDLDYQLDAVEAVCNLFKGQEVCHTEFTITMPSAGSQTQLATLDTAVGLGNRLMLLDDQLHENLKAVQIERGLVPSADLAEQGRNFTVEMETGTGKTYVYLRTILELNRRFGFTKFVIVVPSIAIKEGVMKTLQITEEHFATLYGGERPQYFAYDGSRLSEVRSFAASSRIQIMVITIASFFRPSNVFWKASEKLGGDTPGDLVGATRPIVIVDEPQSVDGGPAGAGRKALEKLNSLCELRYSATQKDKYHMIYCLDAVDAYERRLVKQIEVASALIDEDHNAPWVRFLSTTRTGRQITASVELDCLAPGGFVRRRRVRVACGDDLEQAAGNRAAYRDYMVGDISLRGDPSLELRVPNREPVWLKVGEAHGHAGDDLPIARAMIRKTIEEHLRKQLRLEPQGIKVLTLFFIPEVALYRAYDADGQPLRGPYAQIFEEEYLALVRSAEFANVHSGIPEAQLPAVVEAAHNGYFSIDRNQRWSDTSDANEAGREAATRAYDLIMRAKEELLSLETPLRFIFSHSALREGWDNPNVFQICVLRDIRTQQQRRQTIGRGLRLCVGSDGNRVRGFEVNTLTVVANESYVDFAENLQREIQEETGLTFGVVTREAFAAAATGTVPLGVAASAALWDHLARQGLIDATGKVQDSLRGHLAAGTLALPDAFKPSEAAIIEILKKADRRVRIKNAADRRDVPVRDAVYESDAFRELWRHISNKTTYRVDFEEAALRAAAVQRLRDAGGLPRRLVNWSTGTITIRQDGIEAVERVGEAETRLLAMEAAASPLPDVLTELEIRTGLTRKLIAEVLRESGRLEDFKKNPQAFIDMAARELNAAKGEFFVKGISYTLKPDDARYAYDLLKSEALSGYEGNLLPVQKAVYEQVVFDSGIEHDFAQELENHQEVKAYVKLPGWFTIATPLGSYNPDWAVLTELDGEERLYLVIETKGSTDAGDLRDAERDKITCGEKHFEAIAVASPQVRYQVATTFADILRQGD